MTQRVHFMYPHYFEGAGVRFILRTRWTADAEPDVHFGRMDQGVRVLVISGIEMFPDDDGVLHMTLDTMRTLLRDKTAGAYDNPFIVDHIS